MAKNEKASCKIITLILSGMADANTPFGTKGTGDRTSGLYPLQRDKRFCAVPAAPIQLFAGLQNHLLVTMKPGT